MADSVQAVTAEGAGLLSRYRAWRQAFAERGLLDVFVVNVMQGAGRWTGQEKAYALNVVHGQALCRGPFHTIGERRVYPADQVMLRTVVSQTATSVGEQSFDRLSCAEWLSTYSGDNANAVRQ